MKKFVSITLILSVILSISCCGNVFASVGYYPECSMLPRYDSLGYYVSTIERDENHILQLENGLEAYVLWCTASNGQEYIQKLVSDYGWSKIASSSQNNTGYNVLQKENNYIGIAVFYGPSSSADYIHIYPNLGSNYSQEEPAFYNEYSELPMLSLYASTQYIYRFKTPEDMIGYAYKDCYTVHYVPSIIEDVYGWEKLGNVRSEQGHANIYTKNNTKICIANFNDDYTYIFGIKNQLNASDLNNYISYAKQHQIEESEFIYGGSKSITVTLNGNYINFDVQPTEINGRVLVPVRAIFEALGAKVDWNESKNEVIATKGDVTIRLYKDNTTMYRNSETITLDVPAKDIGNRILVPVRAISEAFGCKVDWSDANSQVNITTENKPENSNRLLKCGENLTYVRNGNTIEISGKGEMHKNFFNYDDTLENVIINEGVTNVSKAAFARCTKLKSVTLPSTLKKIEDNAFRGCLYLQDINIPESVSSIGEEAFWECESLRSLTIPESVKAIGSDAFSFCTNLKEVQILGEIKIDKKDIFYGSDNVIIVEKNNSTTNFSSSLDESELRMHILSLGWSVYPDYPVPDYGDITGQRRNYTALGADLWYIYDNYSYPTSVDNDVKTYCRVLELCGFEFESERELSEYATMQTASITYRYKNTPLRVHIIREVWNRTASKEYTVRVYPFYGNY